MEPDPVYLSVNIIQLPESGNFGVIYVGGKKDAGLAEFSDAGFRFLREALVRIDHMKRAFPDRGRPFFDMPAFRGDNRSRNQGRSKFSGSAGLLGSPRSHHWSSL